MPPPVERRSPPPLVKEIRKVGMALAGAVGLWAATQALLGYRTLRAVEAMRARPDTVRVTVTDTLNICRSRDGGTRTRDSLPF